MSRVNVAEVELANGIDALPGGVVHRLLVRYRSRPVGWVSLDARQSDIVSRDRFRDELNDQLGLGIVERGLGDKLFPAASAPASIRPISVVVCTRNRTAYLAGCLDALLKLDYPQFEIIIVDNAPSTDETMRLVEERARGAGVPLRYVLEPAAGLDRARNRGIVESSHELIAFTDDDARVDPSWLDAINQAFADPGVMAVTGLVAPAELDHPAQAYFELVYGGMGKGFRRRRIHRAALSRRALLWASAFGVGANMAFRKAVFESVGPFDVSLDVGSPARGCGDVDMFYRIVSQGHLLVYEPSALVWHHHRPTFEALRAQLFDNGCSFGVYLLKRYFSRETERRHIVWFAAREWIVGWILRRLIRPGKHDRKMVLPELFGMLWSPVAYIMSRREVRVDEEPVEQDGAASFRPATDQPGRSDGLASGSFLFPDPVDSRGGKGREAPLRYTTALPAGHPAE